MCVYMYVCMYKGNARKRLSIFGHKKWPYFPRIIERMLLRNAELEILSSRYAFKEMLLR